MNAVGGISCVNYQLSFVDNLLVIVSAVVGHDQHAIIASDVFQGSGGHVQVVVPSFANRREEWIVIVYLCATLAQQLDDRQRRRFTQIVDVPLVGDRKSTGL